MPALLVQIVQRYQSGANHVVALVNEGLFQVLFEGLHVQIVDDLGEDPQGVGFVHLVVVLTHVLRQLGDNYEYLVLSRLELLDKHVHESSQVLSAWRVDLEKLRHVKEHLALLVFREVLALISQPSQIT